MRIGIDARVLSQQTTGIGRYTEELIKELAKKDGKFFLYSPDKFVTENWRLQNVTLTHAGFSSRLGRMWWSQTYLPYWAAENRLDVFWGTAHRIPTFLPFSIARVVTIHDLVWKYAGETMRPLSFQTEKRLMPIAVKLADRIVTVSESTANDLKDEYPKIGERIKTVYPGPGKLPARKSLGRSALASLGINQPYFLFVGTLEPRKNLSRLLNSFSKIDPSIVSKHQLVIVGGEGWGDVDIHQLIKNVGLGEQVVVTGYVSDLELSTIYQNALFLAMPSLYEGFGFPILEAMLYGVPVLTSNNSSMPEVAGDAGVFVNPLDESSIAAGLSLLLDNKTYRNELASKARINAKRFTWQNAANDMWDTFREALRIRRQKKQDK